MEIDVVTRGSDLPVLAGSLLPLRPGVRGRLPNRFGDG
jgi:hypothetical protein